MQNWQEIMEAILRSDEIKLYFSLGKTNKKIMKQAGMMCNDI